MENKGHVWITASCFYPIKAWPKLFKEIEIVLLGIKCKKRYDLEINSELGDNIRLSVLVPIQFYNYAASYIGNNMTSFFQENFYSSINSRIETPQLPFPTSVIQFNLYSKFPANDTFDHKKNENLSDCIMIALNEDVDYDSVIVLSCYLQLCLLKLCLNFVEIDFLKECFSVTSKTENAKLFSHYIDNSKGYLKEIFKEIEHDDFLNQNYKWLYDWKRKINEELVELISEESSTDCNTVVKTFLIQNTALIKTKLHSSRKLTLLVEYLLEDFVFTYFRKRIL